MLSTTSMNIIDSLSPSAIDRSINGLGEYILYLCSGNRPTSAQFDSLIGNMGYDSYYGWSLASLLTPLGGKTVLSMFNLNRALPIEVGPERIEFKFSAIPDQAASLENDAPTWGLLGFWPRSTSSTHTSWQPRALLYFTIGDQNSGEDMLIQGGVIPKGTMWKPNDIVLTLTGAIK